MKNGWAWTFKRWACAPRTATLSYYDYNATVWFNSPFKQDIKRSIFFQLVAIAHIKIKIKNNYFMFTHCFWLWVLHWRTSLFAHCNIYIFFASFISMRSEKGTKYEITTKIYEQSEKIKKIFIKKKFNEIQWNGFNLSIYHWTISFPKFSHFTVRPTHMLTRFYRYALNMYIRLIKCYYVHKNEN